MLQDDVLLSGPLEGYASILWPSFSAMGRLCFKIVAFFQCLGKAVLQDCPSFRASGRLCFNIVAFF